MEKYTNARQAEERVETDEPERLDLSSILVEQKKSLPDEPGVYLFRDSDGEIVYVGKAKSVRKRVASHFGKPVTGRARDMIEAIEQIDFLVTGSESEALLIEHTFIKRYRPRFNVLMRDDKSYPYIAISVDEEYPRVYFTRERHRPRRLYFGPFSGVRRVRKTLDVLAKAFKFRTCEGEKPGRASGSPCLDFYIKRCSAPCIDEISKDEYRRSINAIIGFLSGKHNQVLKELEARMQSAAEAQNFEQAATERDRLEGVRSLFSKERVVRRTADSVDFIAVAAEDADANAQVLQVRDGVIADRHSFYLQNKAIKDVSDVVEEFAVQYYSNAISIPPKIILQKDVSISEALEEALSERRQKKVRIVHAERGEKRRVIEMAERNAHLALSQDKLKAEHRHQRRAAGLGALKEALDLDTYPIRIECFDVSNLGSANKVASMVVFEGGEPNKDHYRHFNIRTVKGQDDFASISEVLGRRLARFEDAHLLSPYDEDRDESFAAQPDVIVIDGGKGQLSSGIGALRGFRERGVCIISLAKQIEEVFLPSGSTPLLLSRDSPGLLLLQGLRDEAHRFAITHHRGQRKKAMTASIFDELPGVGPARKQLLLKHFGSPQAFTQATLDEMEAVPGLPEKVARDIYSRLNKTG